MSNSPISESDIREGIGGRNPTVAQINYGGREKVYRVTYTLSPGDFVSIIAKKPYPLDPDEYIEISNTARKAGINVPDCMKVSSSGLGIFTPDRYTGDYVVMPDLTVAGGLIIDKHLMAKFTTNIADHQAEQNSAISIARQMYVSTSGLVSLVEKEINGLISNANAADFAIPEDNPLALWVRPDLTFQAMLLDVGLPMFSFNLRTNERQGQKLISNVRNLLEIASM